MITLLNLISITSILVLAWTIVTQENMLLYSVREWANKKQDEGAKWVEPVLLCHWCMPSVWASLGYLFAYGIGVIEMFTWRLFILYPLVVGGSSIVNGLLWGWHKKIESEKEKNEAETEYYERCNAHDEIQNYEHNHN